jgi:hypothetical protein
MSQGSKGQCQSCTKEFSYRLQHNGFGDSAFAYCDRCGSLASLSGWFAGIPEAAHLKVQGPINPEAEALLAPCACGGTFRAGASPRCPHCLAPLDATAATAYIERDAPGTEKGWRWQRSWQGTYSIVVEERWVQDNWAKHDVA